MHFKPVIQEEPTGCGIAAVANILGLQLINNPLYFQRNITFTLSLQNTISAVIR